ncbi:hypothetical protein [uncultured Gimesia sp.]|uniref:hypothetical protein n=1 Tax=uncultured Gimesia sp. TaxID=1678688 RepID=UPI00262737C1|nr:hypothetical protein [uncultured Gimesia sp.]
MNQQNTHILTLIKLLEGHLSDAEEVSVREQLASDSLMLQRWKTLSQLYKQQMTPGESVDRNTAAIDAEAVAAFVEERMSPDQKREFESLCWNQTESLREVVSAYQAAHRGVSSTSDLQQYELHAAQTTKRMRDVVKEQCPNVDSISSASHYLEKIEDDSQSPPNSTALDSNKSEVVSVEHLSRTAHSDRKSTKGIKRTALSQRRVYFVVAAVLVVIVIAMPVYIRFVQNEDSTSITENPVPGPPPSIPEIPGSNTKQPFHSNPDPKLTVVPERKPPVNLPQRSPKVIPVHPVMDKQGNEQPVVAKKGSTIETEIKLDLQLDWVRMSGIIGSRTADSLPWKGILADASAKQVTDEKHLELHTLPFSWLQGIIQTKSSSSGPEIVLDADSEIQIAIRGVKALGVAKQADTESGSIQTVIDLKLIAGKVAISQLQAGDVVKIQDQRQAWLIQVKQDGSAVGFVQRDENKREIMAFAGGFQVTSPTSQQAFFLNSDQMIVMSNHSFSAPLKIAGKLRWRTEPPKSLKLSKSFLEKMNQSDDLMSALLSISPGKVGAELLASTNLGFALDPAIAVSQAAFSNSEVQRTAAITWLIAAKEDSTTRTVWRKINIASNAGPATPSIRNWFNIVQGKALPNQNILTELSAGLGARQPLFVRQCSIHFLRQLTRQRLAEYDPNRPSPAAINSVRQKVRRATGNTRPKSNNSNRRAK